MVVLAATERAIFLLVLALHSSFHPQNPQWNHCVFKCGIAYKVQTQNKQEQRKKGSKELFEEGENIKSLALQLKDVATGFAVATQGSRETWST